MSEWWEGIAAAVTVTDADGVIVAMNAAAREVFAADGGAALIGSSVLGCHPEPARTQLAGIFERREENHYTIAKRGRRKVIHQLPYFSDGAFAGFVEISVPLPGDGALPHIDRG